MQLDLFGNSRRQQAVDFIAASVLRNEPPCFMGSTGPGEGIQIGGYVADPLPWDQVSPLRKLKPGEIAVWDDAVVEYFSYAELARELLA